ncbi:MBL fold metallo-hydrolase [uncultured Pseudoteredinibacter sp.]|uniref:MBL fold metallo-hydrolase n=1 Tax=uncultured Pseudoteredinibacter sp. TaxID=1641701 RepID=UPI0026019A75|nr:MBL fold metallo-hydrolase [uncultured Pseudoteredinibacter sp.]
MRFASLGSGSRGNATVVQAGRSCVLMDCGFTIKETEKRLAALDLAAGDIDAIVVTHEHGDHIKGVPAFARKHGMPVYMTPGTYRARDLGKIPELVLIENYQSFQLGDLHIEPVAVPHDAREPAQFIFSYEELRLGVLTDLGNVSAHVEKCYQDCDALLLEANHDSMMLAMGPYPPSLKDRVGGPWGHLNNQQALRFVKSLDLDRLKQLVIAHISEKNNALSKVQEVFQSFNEQLEELHFANQEEGFGWVTVGQAISEKVAEHS